jgi:hypothetical protein
LIVKAGKVGREQVAGDDLDVGFLESGDLRREVVAERRELSRIDDGETGVLERGNEGIMPRVVVLGGVEQRAHDFVGLLLLPEADKGREHLIEAPKEMIGPGEAFLRRIAAVIVGFPRIVGRDARHLIELGDVGGRIAVDRAARGGDDVHLVFQNKLAGDFRGASLVGLAVLGDDLDLVGLSADLQSGRQYLADAGERPILRFGEARHGAGFRADVADLDDEVVGAQHSRGERRAGRNRRGAGLQQAATGRVNQDRPATITSNQILVFHFVSSP